MEKLSILALVSVLLLVPTATAAGTQDGSEDWGYVEVRPKAHMFWWLYKSPHRVEDPSKPWPIILWLQGGPGASGVGIGNFEEIGPLDTNLKPRNSTWLQKDNPVGKRSKLYDRKKVRAEEKSRLGDEYTYDIWGDHFSRLLLGRSKDTNSVSSSSTESDPNSFLVKGPQVFVWKEKKKRKRMVVVRWPQ